MELLPHLIGVLNATMTSLIIVGIVAIRRGQRQRHPKLMLGALCLGVLFLICYVAQTALVGHQRFPGDDWVRSLFLAILASHTLLAVAIVPLVLRTVYLAARRRLEEHRRLARITFPTWIYVGITGLVIYWMNNHLRPPVP
jgi:uncharacterized membrane protein YozB (DUF420 family)